MKRIRIALLTTLLLLPAARVWGQAYDAAGPRELYHAEVCNEGRIKVDVAVAYKDFGFSDEFWIVDYWYQVAPGKCKLVYSHFYAPNNWLSFQSFPLYLAFAFTDSTGVWGAAKVNPPRGIAASRLHLCVGRKNYEYRVNGKNPEAKCPQGLPIPVSMVWEPTQGVYSREFGGYPSPKRFTVALGPNDRAIALGPQASPGETAQGPGVLKGDGGNHRRRRHCGTWCSPKERLMKMGVGLPAERRAAVLHHEEGGRADDTAHSRASSVSDVPISGDVSK